MLENRDASTSPPEDNSASDNYLRRAVAACEAGDAKLGLHLYLAAFEQALETSETPSEEALLGLKQAWRVACSTKERALAEYIFERLEPYLTRDEVDACAEQLQSLTFDRLEEFGLSRDDLEEMAETLSNEVMGIPGSPFTMEPFGMLQKSNPRRASEERSARKPKEEEFRTVDILTYSSLSGYARVIDRMHTLGIGVAGDTEFNEFVTLLNTRHGLDSIPASDCILFTSPAREDAARFMMATVGELGLPAIRMRMEESFQGVQMLSVSAQAADAEKLAALHRGFEGGGVLVLEDVDLWGAPLAESSEETPEDHNHFIAMAMSRGAREALNMVHQAIENPEVYVLVSAASAESIDPFFRSLLYPLTCVEVDYPDAEEREDVWMDIAREHPSIRSLRRDDLVRLTAHMPRYDIYMAAREAVESAYKQGLVHRRYIPVTRENLYDKLAAYQPLDSAEYAELEQTVISDFASSLDDLSGLTD